LLQSPKGGCQLFQKLTPMRARFSLRNDGGEMRTVGQCFVLGEEKLDPKLFSFAG
jgi:hypothetical protein